MVVSKKFIWGSVVVLVLLLVFLASIVGLTISSRVKKKEYFKKVKKIDLLCILVFITFVFATFDAQQGSLYDTAEDRADSTSTLINSLDKLNYAELMAIQPYWEDSTRVKDGRGSRWKSRLSQFCEKLDYQLFYLIVLLLLGVIIIINWDEEY